MGEIHRTRTITRTIQRMGPVIVLGNNLSARISFSGIMKRYTVGEACYGSECTVCHNKILKYVGVQDIYR